MMSRSEVMRLRVHGLDGVRPGPPVPPEPRSRASTASSHARRAGFTRVLARLLLRCASAKALRAVATEEAVPLLELNRLTADLERAHGVEGSKRLHLHFGPGEQPRWPDGVKDDTHFSEYGASRVAALAVQELLRLQLVPGTWVR